MLFILEPEEAKTSSVVDSWEEPSFLRSMWDTLTDPDAVFNNLLALGIGICPLVGAYIYFMGLSR